MESKILRPCSFHVYKSCLQELQPLWLIIVNIVLSQVTTGAMHLGEIPGLTPAKTAFNRTPPVNQMFVLFKKN